MEQKTRLPHSLESILGSGWCWALLLRSAAGIFIYSRSKTVWAQESIMGQAACWEVACFCRRSMRAARVTSEEKQLEEGHWAPSVSPDLSQSASKSHLMMVGMTAILTEGVPLGK